MKIFLAGTLLVLAAGPSFAQYADIDAAVDSIRGANERRAAFGQALLLTAQGNDGTADEYIFPGATDDQPRWHYLTKPLLASKASRRRVAGGWRLDTTRETKDSAGFFSLRLPGPVVRPPIDRRAGFTLRFRLAVRAENHIRPQRAGTSVIVIGDDLEGVELGFWENEIWAQTDAPLFAHGEGAAFATGAPVDYELTLDGDRYRLSAAGRVILEGPLKNYSSFGFPYDQRSFLFYGDDTSSAGADMELSDLRAEYGPAAPPAGVAAE